MKKVWVVMIEGERHVVELNADPWFGGRRVYVDTELALKERGGPFDTYEEYRFKVVEKPALLEIKGAFNPRFALYVDGKRV